MPLKFRACRFLSSILAAAGLSALSACAQQAPQPQAPVYTGPTYPRLSAFAQAIGIGPPVKSWRFEIVTTPGLCVFDTHWDWPDMRVVTTFGKTVKDRCFQSPGQLPNVGAHRTIGGLDFRVTGEPLVIYWTDAQKVRHVASFEVKHLMGGRTPYGGGALILEFAGPRVNLYLDEPDFSKETPTRYAPLVRHVLATAE